MVIVVAMIKFEKNNNGNVVVMIQFEKGNNGGGDQI